MLGSGGCTEAKEESGALCTCSEALALPADLLRTEPPRAAPPPGSAAFREARAAAGSVFCEAMAGRSERD